MNRTKHLKGHCQSCGGHIEFAAEAAGMSVDCPHCGEQATLTARRTIHDLENQDMQVELICPTGCRSHGNYIWRGVQHRNAEARSREMAVASAGLP